MQWEVHYNHLYEVDPVPGEVDERLFDQDILRLVNRRMNRVLDVGWYPAFDLRNGFFRLLLFEGSFDGRLLREFETPDRHALVEEIERAIAIW